jgi:hypothetical protein
VPNDQYIVPFVDIDRSGARVTKPKTKELLMNGVANQPATLGRYFLTAAYLMVNHDAGTFTLWQGNPTERSKLVRVFDQDAADKCGKDATGIVQPTVSGDPAEEKQEEPTDQSESSSGPSGAVIGGAVAGDVVGVAAICLGIFFLLRRKRKTRVEEKSSPADVQLRDDKADFTTWYPQEMPGSKQMPAEIQGQSHFVYELDGDARKYQR